MSRALPAHGPVLAAARLTVPAREALEAAGCIVGSPRPDEHFGPARLGGPPLHRVVLQRPPVGLTLVLIGEGREQHHGLRLDSEPEYPGEWRQRGAVAWWQRCDLVPCPRCGSGLVWYEAGYVPGRRLCLRGHMAQLSCDGRSAVTIGRPSSTYLRTPP